ncbi:MAG TPA: single-stranded-DNA-specific exonuclease RecJ [Clostridiales bacterium]|nr:MAG: single-stranded-DNA-specific exonuclease RecJ [Clostridiales bacterium GWD2_32_19]HCC06595.1 single-stranded-DNA-specific exonuclease RecJ [Clostridiales bacterium]
MIKGKYDWNYVDSIEFVCDRDINQTEIIQRLLYNRGIKGKENVEKFLNPTIAQFYDPYLLNDMDSAVTRIIEAVNINERVAIYGDYDVDGITSTSILYLYLKKLGASVDYYIPNRLEEGYGINKNALDILKDSGASLIITVDTGISALEQVEYAKMIGIEIIITDHHECQEIIPNAFAVINPKRPDSTYPFSDLAGVGVAFKLIHALAIKVGNVDDIWEYLGIVAIGTVADIVPLTSENRVIAKFGFEKIKVTTNVGLRALLKEVGYKDTTNITSGFIGFILAPRLNAAGRIDDAKKCVTLFVTDDEEEASSIAKGLEKNNQDRQKLEQRILNEVIECVQNDERYSKSKAIVIAKEGWHHGVIGIVASKIVDKFYKPTILLNIEDGKATGSARSIAGFSIFECVGSGKEFLTKYGGHQMAAGLSLDMNNFENFRKEVECYAEETISTEMLVPKIKIEGELKDKDITINFIKNIEKLEPYGMGNSQPNFSFCGEIENFRLLGKESSHLKLKIRQNNVIIDAIMFNSSEHFKKLDNEMDIMVAGNLQINEWNENIIPQIIIKDIKSEICKLYDVYNIFKSIEHGKLDEISCKKIKNLVCNVEELNISRTDCAQVYKYFHNKKKEGKVTENIDNIIGILNMNIFKILVIMDVFKEMKLARVNILGDNLVEFEVLNSSEKTDLTKSELLIKLNEWLANLKFS